MVGCPWLPCASAPYLRQWAGRLARDQLVDQTLAVGDRRLKVVKRITRAPRQRRPEDRGARPEVTPC